MRPPATIREAESVASAAEAMRDRNTNTLTVVENGDPVGLITARDIVVRYLAEGRSPGTTVKDIMSSDILTCQETQSVEEAAAMMGDHQIRRLPVRNREDKLVGILSVDHIAEDYSEQLAGETLGEIVEAR